MFSKSTGGIYPLDVYKKFPRDSLEIPDELYEKFQDGKILSLDFYNGSVIEFINGELNAN